MFTKIDKKILIISIAAIVLILLAGFLAFEYLTKPENKIENSIGGTGTEIQPDNQNSGEEVPKIGVNVGGVQTEGGNQKGLTICSDKCGDGVCQAADPECKKDMNCICAETPQDCPQDCK